jgi:hypothetical protein
MDSVQRMLRGLWHKTRPKTALAKSRIYDDSWSMDIVLSVLIGVGLSAACGFRVFVPLLILSLASISGQAQLTPELAWLGSYPALITLAVATALEIAAYYLPVVDNFLDALASPAAVIAGTLATASLITDTGPLLKWSLALIAGGGTAGLVQSSTVAARAALTTATGGLANHVLATLEWIGAIATSVLAIIAPVIAISLIATTGCLVGLWLLWRRGRKATA